MLQDEETVISTSIGMVLLLWNSFTVSWQYTVWLEPESKSGTKVEPEPKLNNFGSATLMKKTIFGNEKLMKFFFHVILSNASGESGRPKNIY